MDHPEYFKNRINKTPDDIMQELLDMKDGKRDAYYQQKEKLKVFKRSEQRYYE